MGASGRHRFRIGTSIGLVTVWVGGGAGGAEGAAVSGGVVCVSFVVSGATVMGGSERMRAFVSSGVSTDSFV